MDRRKPITGFGKAGLFQGGIAVDVARLIFSVPLFFIPGFGPMASIIMGTLIGIMAAIPFFFVYKFVFRVNFTERLLARVGAYFIGSFIPIGTTGATAITIWIIGRDDARYNEEALKLVNEGNHPDAHSRTPPTTANE